MFQSKLDVHKWRWIRMKDSLMQSENTLKNTEKLMKWSLISSKNQILISSHKVFSEHKHRQVKTFNSSKRFFASKGNQRRKIYWQLHNWTKRQITWEYDSCYLMKIFFLWVAWFATDLRLHNRKRPCLHMQRCACSRRIKITIIAKLRFTTTIAKKKARNLFFPVLHFAFLIEVNESSLAYEAKKINKNV